MKKLLIFILLATAGVLLLGSCAGSVMKRHYRPGFYVANKKSACETANPDKAESAKQPNEKQSVAAGTKAEPQGADLADGELKAPSETSITQRSKTSKPMLREIFKPVEQVGAAVKNTVHAKAEKIIDPEAGIIAKTLSLFWIVLLLILLIYLAVILFGSESLLPLGHVIGIVFVALLLLWLLRVL